MGPFDHAEPGGSDAQPQTGKVVGSVAELWRYPVKSMRGGTVSQLLITDRKCRGPHMGGSAIPSTAGSQARNGSPNCLSSAPPMRLSRP